jgi:hypothetical protein
MILKVSVSVFLIDLMAYSTILPSNNLYSFDVTGIISLKNKKNRIFKSLKKGARKGKLKIGKKLCFYYLKIVQVKCY